MTTVKIRINENYDGSDKDRIIGKEYEAPIGNSIFGTDCAFTEDGLFLSREYDIIEEEGLKRGDFVIHTNDHLGPDKRSVGVVLTTFYDEWLDKERASVRWVWANQPDAYEAEYPVEMLRKIG